MQRSSVWHQEDWGQWYPSQVVSCHYGFPTDTKVSMRDEEVLKLRKLAMTQVI